MITLANVHHLTHSAFVEAGDGENEGLAVWRGRREGDGVYIQIAGETVEEDLMFAFFVAGEHTQSIRLSYDAVDGVLQLLGYFLASAS